ncbi:RagB/SusD family nutrient uptake outer membrane protein [Niabella beijingensis]|uniref:RagB/SusD family nutrient uptake outer membrane protein n=1 Tax=Niabella beijingensis TaxID=2872700 RepID=UPI001CC06C9B|nr:RagB/SusD family nutrient uptake outer membrane protein [Niabella beijingensis]MBZ4191102.1 RagB/SusD family nutrient uptake outer membrane protein [Niabella beijingensis]
MKNEMARLFIAGLIILSVCSCRKNYLEKTDPTKINQELFYTDHTQVEQAINGCYSLLQSIGNTQWLFNEMVSDNTTFDFNPDDRGQADKIESYETWTYTAVNGNITDWYNLHYNAIYNINNTLFRMQKAELTDSLKNVDEGQLKFLRAYLYFELVQYFGDVVLITQPLAKPSEAWNYSRKPQDSIYAQIESDLKAAANGLPISYAASHLGRATKGAALTLLGKMFLTRKKYAEAVSTLNQVLALGYELVPEYADVFDPVKKNGPESVFEIQYKGGTDDNGEWSSFIYTFGPRLSKGAVTGFDQSNPSGWNIPTNDLIQAYEGNDKRKGASVGLDFKSPKTGLVVPYIKKYQHAHSVIGRTEDNWPVLRYADVLLMLAEAINEQEGPTADAYKYLNQVRQRAGLANASGLGQTAFREKVLHERRMELAFENWRWFDLKRTMTVPELTAFLNAYGAKEKANPTIPRQGIPSSASDYKFESFRALYPIPNNELIINKDLGQNPGY